MPDSAPPVLLLVVCQDRATAKWAAGPSVVTYFPGRGTLIEKAYLEGEAKGAARGEALGEARAVLRVLETRSVPVPVPVSDAVRERITACTDLDRLDDWLGRALTVERAEELFDGDATG